MDPFGLIVLYILLDHQQRHAENWRRPNEYTLRVRLLSSVEVQVDTWPVGRVIGFILRFWFRTLVLVSLPVAAIGGERWVYW